MKPTTVLPIGITYFPWNLLDECDIQICVSLLLSVRMRVGEIIIPSIDKPFILLKNLEDLCKRPM